MKCNHCGSFIVDGPENITALCSDCFDHSQDGTRFYTIYPKMSVLDKLHHQQNIYINQNEKTIARLESEKQKILQDIKYKLVMEHKEIDEILSRFRIF